MPKVGERYIIELSEELKSADDKYYMIKGIGNTMISTYEVSRLKKYERDDEAYQRGLDEAWKAAEKVLMLESEELKEIFDVIYEEEVFGNFTPAKAIEKLRAYEEQKKAEDEIKVGDEVERNGITEGVITRIRTDDDWFQVMQSNGSSYGTQKSNLKKTGRHFPQVAELLAALGEGE
ncbi:hypothetical protein [Ruminococcus flavefaciens]|uniref:hypothetical protein n=1 Tax=Ruminococcus flavefaciens TaxID=1265 RepID=UPI0026EF3FB8|nr:hypothetical protein [Ruminococcus flavefaciens]